MKDLMLEDRHYSKILVDTANLTARCLYGMGALSYNGVKTGALMGLARSYFALHTEFPHAKIMYLLEGGHNRRKELYSEYKANRSKNDDFVFAIKQSIEFIKLVDCEYLSMPGLEADDVAFYIVQHRAKNQNILLISGDYDWLTMVNNKHVDIQMKDVIETHTDIATRLGYPPSSVPIVKVLQGDTADNVKGITRFPTAAALVLANKCKTYQDIKGYPLHKHNPGWAKWEQRIIDEWDTVIERNAEVLNFHPEWCHKEEIVRKQGTFNKKKVRRLLLNNGIKSIVARYLGD
jgi:5'-3' exonuclease